MKYVSRIVLILLAFACAACGGESLINGLNTNVGVTKTLTAHAIHHGTEDDTGGFPDYLQGDGTKLFVNDLGIAITLTKAAISWGHIQLISEGNDPECEAGHDAELHVENIENILDADLVEMELMAASIEDTAYCQFQVELTPDNAESPGLDLLPGIAGHSAYITGSWTHGAESGIFEIALDEELVTISPLITIEGHETIEHPFHFHEGDDAASLTFGFTYDRWFDGVTFAESLAELEIKVADNIIGSIGQYLDSH